MKKSPKCKKNCNCLTCQGLSFSDRDKLINKNIKENGFTVIPVVDASFVYTVGLWETYHHPELIICSINMDFATHIIFKIAELIKNGFVIAFEEFRTDVFSTEINNKMHYGLLGARFIMNKHRQETCGMAFGRGHDDFEVLQLVISNMEMKLPWHDDFRDQKENTRLLYDDVCWTCKAKMVNGNRCSTCKIIRYCSNKCQKEHWNIHKKMCRKN